MKKINTIWGIILLFSISLFLFASCKEKTDLAWRDNSTHVAFGSNNYYIDILNQTDASIENIVVTLYYSYKPGILDDSIETMKEFFIAEIGPLAILSSGYHINFSSENCFSSSKITKITYLDANERTITINKIK